MIRGRADQRDSMPPGDETPEILQAGHVGMTAPYKDQVLSHRNLNLDDLW